MGYFPPTDQGSIHEAINLGAAQKSERPTQLSALERAAQSSSMRELKQQDRVTLSPAADALAQASREQGPASAARLDVLREAIKASSMPTYPRAIAESILREEGHGRSSDIDTDGSTTSFA